MFFLSRHAFEVAVIKAASKLNNVGCASSDSEVGSNNRTLHLERRIDDLSQQLSALCGHLEVYLQPTFQKWQVKKQSSGNALTGGALASTPTGSAFHR